MGFVFVKIYIMYESVVLVIVGLSNMVGMLNQTSSLVSLNIFKFLPNLCSEYW